MNSQVKIFLGVIAFLILGTIVTVFLRSGEELSTGENGKYDAFAVCLKDKGAKFYGTFWCPYCNEQKKMFGASQKLLPYVECSTPDGRSQTNECREKEIESYPTWEFADGEKIGGVIPFNILAQKTNCALPG